MDFDAELRDALESKKDVSAVACMDGRAGLVLGLWIQGEAQAQLSRDEVELAVLSAPQLCAAPALASILDEDEIRAGESFVASAEWIHAFVRVPARPDLLVVGLAPGSANVTLLRAWLREVAGRVGQAA